MGTGTAFRFLGFDDHVIEDTVFRSMMDSDSDAVIEVSCRDFADGVLSIRFDADKIDETGLLGGFPRGYRTAVAFCGSDKQEKPGWLCSSAAKA